LIFAKLTWSVPETVKDTSHCPDCGRELPAQAQVSGECPYCKLAQGAPDTAKKSQGSRRGIGLPYLPLVLGVFVVGAGGAYLYLRLRRNQPTGGEVEFTQFRCPSCKRKLRFPVHKAGSQGLCPSCKRRCVFPHVVRNDHGSQL
jgi:hypothetical protein